MPVETRWYVEKRLIYQRFYGFITLEEFAESIGAIQQFVNAGTPLIHAIADVTDVLKYPPLSQLTQTARRTSLEGMGWTVVVVSNPMLRFIGTLLAQFTVSHVYSVRTIDEAVRFLARRDPSLEIVLDASPPDSLMPSPASCDDDSRDE